MVIAIIQARMSSVRFPKKILEPIGTYTLLEHIILRLKKVPSIQKIVLATTKRPEDFVLKKYSQKYQIEFFQGSEKNVLERFYQVAKKYQADDIIRICADSPFIDGAQIEKMYQVFKQEKPDLLTVDPQTTSLLDGVEILSFSLLSEMFQNTTDPQNQEHVTLMAKQKPSKYRVHFYTPPKNLQKTNCRITIDYKEDLIFCKKIVFLLQDLYPDGIFPVEAILNLNIKTLFEKRAE